MSDNEPESKRKRIILYSVGLLLIGAVIFFLAEGGSPHKMFDQVRKSFDATRRSFDQQRRDWEQARRAEEQAQRQAQAARQSNSKPSVAGSNTNQ
jgi:hypothetical protein